MQVKLKTKSKNECIGMLELLGNNLDDLTTGNITLDEFCAKQFPYAIKETLLALNNGFEFIGLKKMEEI